MDIAQSNTELRPLIPFPRSRAVSYEERIPNLAPLALQYWGEPVQSLLFWYARQGYELGGLGGSARSKTTFPLFFSLNGTTRSSIEANEEPKAPLRIGEG